MDKYKRSKRLSLFLLAVVLLIPAAGCNTPAMPTTSQDYVDASISGQPELETVKLSIAMSSPDKSTSVTVLRNCARAWKESSGGRIDMNIYSNSRLGNDELLLVGAVQGTLSIVKMDVAQLEQMVPEVALLSIPYTFDSPEEYNALLRGSFGDLLQGCFERAGLKLLNSSALSWKYLTSNVALKTPEDLSKLRIRVLNNSGILGFWRACGAKAGTLDHTELYMALKDGTFNTQDNPVQMVAGYSLGEVQKYLIDTKHQLATHAFVMNLEQYNALPADVQEGFEAFFQSFSDQYRQSIEESTEQVIHDMEIQGKIQVLELPDSVRSAMVAAREPVLAELRQSLGDATVDAFLSALKTAKQAA